MAKLLTFLCVVSFISTALACSSALSDDTDLTTTPTKYSDSSAPYSVTSTLPKEKLGSSEGTPRELEAVWEAWALLNKEHIDRASFEPGAFEESAIKGLIDSVEDTHTAYVDPLVLQIEQTDLSGQFEGIGAHVRRREDGMIQIISPIEGGPAEAAGILAGDIILAVDGESIEGLELLEAVSKIRGPKGSIVSLTVKHIGQLETTIIEVSRDVIALPSVLLRSDPGDEITHIRITEFKGDTPMRLSEILNAELEAGSKGLILDLRSNPGGYLQQVFDITNMFLDDGIILLEERQNENVTWRASGGGFATNLPMVVLVNKYSASGSEILMGAFQDNDRATVIGEQTFGKGTVNVFRKLSNGGGLYMSVGRWYTPNKRPIEGEGLTPDILVTSRDSKEADIKQVDAAYDEINKLLND
ncbi:MAG: S41 family peptidase [Chloroflexota bacterium]|uniref:PDZ domain-containing protein n=1 Tax=marine metagenome TaxID=408172 RepID=A0A381QQF3_9ZZZZ|nr:S41 family peptidase [Chloroflexota bacterium]|tara:strand:- start:6853 stop:8097 length:1245 start_codon:yes stop_codon:yes gene_type:complete